MRRELLGFRGSALNDFHPEHEQASASAALPWYARATAWPLRRLAVLVAIIAVWQRAIFRKARRPGWKLEGGCRSCGRCCENLLLEASDESPWLTALRAFWHECVFDFYPKGNVLETESGRFAAYGCHNFTADRRCARYALRPFVCRAYPALALFDRPAPRAHCGFRVIDE